MRSLLLGLTLAANVSSNTESCSAVARVRFRTVLGASMLFLVSRSALRLLSESVFEVVAMVEELVLASRRDIVLLRYW